jgi:hypothetical protein
MIGILNSLPNMILDGNGNGVNVVPVKVNEVPKGDSFIGHSSFANALSVILSQTIDVSRLQFSWENYDIAFCCLVQPTRRLAEGEFWSESEILSFPVKIFKVTPK